MATVAQLAAADFHDVGYLFVVEGHPVAFTDRHELAGSGASSWIGDDPDIGEGRTVVLGLEPPQSVKLAIGVVDSGMLIDDGATFKFVDSEGHLIAFAEDEPGTALSQRLAPTDDPAPATLVDAGGNNATIHERWVNGEAIGAGGVRRLFQIIPGNPLPGQDHAAIDSPDGDVGLRPSVVRDAPRWLEGRACALYLIRRDPVADTWAPWDEQYESGYSLIWWGTLARATAQSVEWTFECDGPSSWLRKTLNVNRPATWLPLSVPLTFAEGEDKVAVALCYRNAIGDASVGCGRSLYTSTLTPDQTPDALASEINAILQTAASTPGPHDTFDSFQLGEASLTADEFRIRCDDNTSGSNGYALGAVCQLRMHERAWLHMGWDLRTQGLPLGTTLDSEFEVEAVGGSVFYVIEGDAVNDPMPDGYFEAQFSTLPVGVAWNGEQWRTDGDGVERVYRSVLSSQISVLWPGGAQTIKVGTGLDTLYLEGQLAKPPADVTLDGVSINSGVCNAAGFFAIRGGYRESIDEEPETHYQVARVSWVDNDERVATHTDERAIVWLQDYADPRLFGATNDKLTGPWSGADLEFCPVAFLGYNIDGPDAAHRVLLRLLLSTGTADWSGVGDAATVDPGVNTHGLGGKGDDLEVADLGLGIPVDLVDAASFATAADSIPGGKGGPLNMTKLACVGPFDAQQLIEDILRPRAWCFSLDGGRYGLFARSAPPSLDDVQVAITQDDIAAEVDELPPSEAVDFRPLDPIDLIEVRYGAHQLGGDSEEKTLTLKARDPRAALRRGNTKAEIDGRTLLADGSWKLPFATLWTEQMSEYLGQTHAMVTVSVKGSTARDLWPGTVVSYTSPWPATQAGQYGMTARVGRVVSVERDLSTLAATCEVLVDGRDPSTRRLFAPVAALLDDVTTVEARHDSATRRLFCRADAFGRGGSQSDVAAFNEPAWSTTGGDLKVHVYQSADGVTWDQTAEFVVESVDTTAHTITYKAGSLTGSAPNGAGIWERKLAVLVAAPYDDQDPGSWPRAVFGVTCSADGKFGSGDEAGHPWTE